MLTIRMDTLVVIVAIGVVVVAMALMASSLVVQSLLNVNATRQLADAADARRHTPSRRQVS